MKFEMSRRIPLIMVGILLAVQGCGKKKDESGSGIFSFSGTTIVTAATPAKIRTASASLATEGAVSTSVISQIKDRLYTSQAGNTIPNMVKAFDGRVTELNDRAAGFPDDSRPACLSATPTETAVVTPDGQSFKFFVQCFDDFGTSGFMSWGVDTTADKNIYIFEKGPNSISVVKVTPQADSKYIFDGYMVSNYKDGTSSSGTVVHIVANETTASTQATMSAPHEVCGVNIYADKDKIHVRGSVSTGDANSCPEETSEAYSASDLTGTTGFDAAKLLGDTYALKRKAGTKLVNGGAVSFQAYTNSSTAGNVTLDQELTSTTSTTDLNFGPDTAAGLGGTQFK